MKELTIEEKAKFYEEALERARIYYSTTDSVADSELIELIFPELKESEDEKIRKELIKFVKVNIPDEERYIAWLEKQGEKPQGKSALEAAKEEKADNQNCVKPVDKVKPKFHEGDIIKPKDGGHEPWQIIQVDISDKKYRFKDGYVIHFSQEDAYELVEKKPAEWSEEDEAKLKSILHLIEGFENKYLIEWLKSLKDRVQPQPQQEWSEEDENNILFLTSIIEECFKNKEKITLYGDTVCANFTKENVIDRLKSIRPQKQWKPSEEQLTQLFMAVSKGTSGYFDKDVLRELYIQLKQL